MLITQMTSLFNMHERVQDINGIFQMLFWGDPPAASLPKFLLFKVCYPAFYRVMLLGTNSLCSVVVTCASRVRSLSARSSQGCGEGP